MIRLSQKPKKITKASFEAYGGLSNKDQYRTRERGVWTYYRYMKVKAKKQRTTRRKLGTGTGY